MMRQMTTFGFLMVALATAGWAQTAPKLPPDYEVLTRKSIFSRDRVTRPPNEGGHSSWNTSHRRPTAPRIYTPILVGAMVEDDGYFVAFIADPASGLLTGYRVGDTLPMNAGTIKEISLDDLTTTVGTTTHKIAIGDNILGGSAEYPSAEPAPAATPAETPTTTPAAAAGDDNGGDGNGATPLPTANSEPGPSPSSTAAPNGGNAKTNGGGTARLPGETMLDYLRRRRAQQLGTK
jgi:hypothetical protein